MADMKCGPENCPLTAWTNLSPSERKRERARLAKELYEQGFTMEQIARQFGVTQQQISLDLANLQVACKLKRAKTVSNPKGAGRPRKPLHIRDAEDRAAALVRNMGMTFVQAAAETGLGSVAGVKLGIAREEGRRDPEINRNELTLTAQQKLDAALRQHQRKLDASFASAVDKGVRERIDEIVLPHWKEKINQAQQLYARRRGLMDKATFNAIRRGLHPDSRNSISDETLAKAFDTFMSLEKYLLDEKDSPTDFGYVPNNLAEWDKMRAAAQAERRKARGNRNAPARH